MLGRITMFEFISTFHGDLIFSETLQVMSECRIHLTALKRPVILKGAGKSLGNGHNSDTMLFENFIDTSWAFFIAPFWPQKVMKYQDDFNALPSQINTAIHHLLKLEQWTLKSYSHPHTWNVERLFGRIVILFTSYHPDHLLHELHPGIYNTCQYYNDNNSLIHSGKESMGKPWKHHFISGTCCLENSQSIAEWSIQDEQPKAGKNCNCIERGE